VVVRKTTEYEVAYTKAARIADSVHREEQEVAYGDV
jgi:hypothetical protein